MLSDFFPFTDLYFFCFSVTLLGRKIDMIFIYRKNYKLFRRGIHNLTVIPTCDKKFKINLSHHLVVASTRISLTLSRHPPYRSSFPAGLQGYTSYPHRAAVCRFELVALLLFGHVNGSIGVHHL